MAGRNVFAPQKTRIPRQLRATHARWSPWSSRPIMPNFAGINQIGSVCVHTCRRDSDRSMAGPRQIASQRVGLAQIACSTSPEYAFRHSWSGEGAQRIARTLSVFEERSGSLVPLLKGRKARVWVSKSSSKTSRAPSFHLRRRVFARETLRSSWVLCRARHWCCCRSLPLGVRVGRYVFVLGDLEDMDITHFLHVVGSEVSVTAESFDLTNAKASRGLVRRNGGPLPKVRACKEARVRRLEASSVLSEICRERWPPESQIDHSRAREVRGAREQPADASLVELQRCCSSTPAALGLAVRQLHTHIALSKQSERDQSTSVARSKQQPRLAARRNPQIKRNQVKSSDQKRAGHTQSM